MSIVWMVLHITDKQQCILVDTSNSYFSSQIWLYAAIRIPSDLQKQNPPGLSAKEEYFPNFIATNSTTFWTEYV